MIGIRLTLNSFSLEIEDRKMVQYKTPNRITLSSISHTPAGFAVARGNRYSIYQWEGLRFLLTPEKERYLRGMVSEQERLRREGLDFRITLEDYFFKEIESSRTRPLAAGNSVSIENGWETYYAAYPVIISSYSSGLKSQWISEAQLSLIETRL